MKLSRRTYADHYGPTTGDRIRLADTDLLIRIERDYAVPGDESKFGGGKVIRDGMGQSPTATRAAGAPDLVITNAVIIDATGIYKADVGVRDGRISAVGKSGNPGVQDGVTAGLEIGASTEILAGEGHSDTKCHRPQGSKQDTTGDHCNEKACHGQSVKNSASMFISPPPRLPRRRLYGHEIAPFEGF